MADRSMSTQTLSPCTTHWLERGQALGDRDEVVHTEYATHSLSGHCEHGPRDMVLILQCGRRKEGARPETAFAPGASIIAPPSNEISKTRGVGDKNQRCAI